MNIFATVKEVVAAAEVDDWDGYGAASINVGSLINALYFLSNLGDDTLPTDASVDPNGDLSFDWRGKDNNMFDNVFVLCFSPENSISYAGIFGESEVLSGTTKTTEIEFILTCIKRVKE